MSELIDFSDRRVALIIPCYNEEGTIASVVRDFRSADASMEIYVFDNGSTDGTCKVAKEAGAIVCHERNRGKGHVVRRMFADVEADYYVMVDGDATYDASSVGEMLHRLIVEDLDMLVGCRRGGDGSTSFRKGHRVGNRLLTAAVKNVFGGQFTDMLSGYRIFSRRYVKSFPSQSVGFEIETELTVHALEMAMPCGELETPYRARPHGSQSKLSTFGDGTRILLTIIRLYMFERPMAFFSFIGAALALLALTLSIPLFVDFYREGLVPRLPTAVLVTGMSVMSLLMYMSGIILDSLARARREMRRFAYLSIPLRGSRFVDK